MTTESKLMSSVEIVARQIGYGRVIQALEARWALMLHRDHGLPLPAAVAGALINDPYIRGLTLGDPEELKKHLEYIAALS